MKHLKMIFISLAMMMILSCSIFADPAPYLISGQMVMDSDMYDEDATFEFSFYNKSSKTVTSFTIVFYLFDEDGNPPLTGRANVTNKISKIVESEEKFESSFSLVKYLSVLPDEPYTVDYLYVSQITYSDGTTWSDPFGMCY